ncbi:PREDICTED: integrator complex subunit 8 [Nicrophorus vespilloides]|uniref:Integrator complex subunit 8 n=1 Tax=Nicrophorus vespilloides TaxID=110193 RepID=A0ABM1N5A6_NICVS|nr:PREDICTED: integrator complex subunit 8 [Nicrophorus vespilloides]
MDVDLLRPGTVPISPDTVLWFEFLLDKNLLLRHLNKPNPDPTPIELITKFTTAIYESMKYEVKKPEAESNDLGNSLEISDSQPKLSLRVIALKILTLKVASYLKWNPVTLRALQFKCQHSVLQDLLYYTNNEITVEIPNVVTNDTTPQYSFALVVYHRWFIGTCMHRILNNSQNRNNSDITAMEENMMCTPENIEKSLNFLISALQWEHVPPMLGYNCFVLLTEGSRETQFEWNEAVPISKEEFKSQIHYDLGAFYFYKENYETAFKNFKQSVNYFKEIKDNKGFCSVDYDCLESYLFACNYSENSGNISLLQQMSNSIVNQYTGILNILIQDNKLREIPLVHRVTLELDIQGALSSGKFTVARDLLPKIQALNAVRCILSRNATHQYNYKTSKALEFFIWATAAVWSSTSELDKRLLATHYMQLIINLESESLLDTLLNHDILNNIFDDVDVDQLRQTVSKIVEIPSLLQNLNWNLPDVKRNPKLDLRLIEQQLISSYDSKEIRDLLVKVNCKNSNRLAWKINPKWELPIPLHSVVTSISRGFIQDFSYVMLAKSKELMLAKDWGTSIEFLRLLEKEIQNNQSLIKLAHLINWEILLVQITQLLEDWPAPHIDRQALWQACENCLKTESVFPRTEIIEQCVLCLLNIGRWEFLISFEKPWSYVDIAASIVICCQDLLKHKRQKKVNKDLWDLIVPIFSVSSSSSKRSSTGNTNIIHRDSPINNRKIQFISFFCKLRDATVLSVIIAILSKLYNILRDDSNLEVSIDTLLILPSSLSNINSYNLSSVADTLYEIVLQALTYFPSSLQWLRVMGDINFSNSNYENALKYYLQTLVVSSDYFNMPVRNDEHVFRRMIKCCTQLGCHTQAAVLCQFSDDPDYTFAFRSLVDFKFCNDSVEAYYHCFWDINILEYLVHFHHKRGEFQRRKKAMHTLGQLELNSSNNEEIQREAINLRKRTFLQAMCKQYVF